MDGSIWNNSQPNSGLFPAVWESSPNMNIGNSSIPEKCYNNLSCYLNYSIFSTSIYVLIYVIMLILGIVGNCLVLFLKRDSSLPEDFAILIRNLAASDVLVTGCCVPFTLIGNIYTPWFLGLFLCKSVSYLQGASVCASVYTLVAIAVDRFLAICCSEKWHISSRGSLYIIGFIWTYSLSLPLPWAIYFQLVKIGETPDGKFLYACSEVWPTDEIEKTYFVAVNLGLYFLVPMLIISFCYFFIYMKVRRRIIPGEGEHNEEIVRKQRTKLVKILIIMVLVFLVNWLPLYVIFTIIKLGGSFSKNSVFLILVPIAQGFGALNSSINPVLYVFLNPKLRGNIKAFFFRREPCPPSDV